jgi:hypothetical protein
LIIKINKTNSSVTAKIVSISYGGLMTVSFTPNIKVPLNYSSFNESNLDIIAISNFSEFEIDLAGLNWTIANFSTSIMYIQLTFDNPLYVSEI